MSICLSNTEFNNKEKQIENVYTFKMRVYVWCVHAHTMVCVETRAQLAGYGSLLPLCGS